MTRALLSLTLLSLLACSGHPSAPPAPPHFSIHEWGLIAAPSGTLDAVALSGALDTHTSPATHDDVHPSFLDNGAVGLKPVIYVHVDGAAEVEVSIRVRAPAGKMLETAPRPMLGAPEEAAWAHLHATGAASCATPRTPRPSCQTEDGYCEAIEDPFYDAATASCLHLRDGSERNHLLYRARVDGARLPFAASWPTRGALRLRNVSDVRIPGPAWHVSYNRVVRFDPPAPGHEVDVPTTGSVSLDETRSALLDALRAHGLDDAEVHAFDFGWAHVLFGAPLAPELEHLQTGRAPAALAQSYDTVLYFLPDELAQRILPMDVTPRPTSVHRALVIRMDTTDTVNGALEPPSPFDFGGLEIRGS